jgi:hypothetical protein
VRRIFLPGLRALTVSVEDGCGAVIGSASMGAPKTTKADPGSVRLLLPASADHEVVEAALERQSHDQGPSRGALLGSTVAR